MRFPRIAILALATMNGSEIAMAFDCLNVTLPSTVVICSDPDLVRLADERQQVYNETRSRLAPEQQKALWDNQKAWVRNYAGACGVPADAPPPGPIPQSVIDCFKRSAEARATYLRTYGPSVSATSNSAPTLRATPIDVSNVQEVALVQAGKLFEIPVQINKAITLNFIIDSGASDVQIPVDVFSTLIRARTIGDADIVGEQTYILADGSKHKASKFIIRELKIGKYILRNVAGGVGSPTGALLLGQSFLSHFDSWTIDNNRHILKLAGKAEGASIDATSNSSRVDPLASLSAPTVPYRDDPSPRTAVICGKSIEFTIEREGSSTGFLGVWRGNWNNAGRLCGAMIVQSIDPQGTADVLYIYGSTRPGSGPAWKQQRQVAILRGSVLSFQDDQGCRFDFYPGPPLGMPEELTATFAGRSGNLTGTFQKLR